MSRGSARRLPSAPPVSPSAVAVRDFEGGDRAACMAIFESNVPDFFHATERDEFSGFLDDLPGPYLVLGDGEQIVACGGYAVGDGGAIADLCWGMVRRDLHGRGYGKHLTLLRVGLALEQPGVNAVLLNTSQHTRGFYEGVGFRLVSCAPDGYGPGLDRCDMRLEARTIQESDGSD